MGRYVAISTWLVRGQYTVGPPAAQSHALTTLATLTTLTVPLLTTATATLAMLAMLATLATLAMRLQLGPLHEVAISLGYHDARTLSPHRVGQQRTRLLRL